MGSSFKGMLGQVLLQSQKCSTSDMKGPEEQNILSVRIGLKSTMPNSSTNRGCLKGNQQHHCEVILKVLFLFI